MDNAAANGPQQLSEKSEGDVRRSLTGRKRDVSKGSKRSAQPHTGATDNQSRSIDAAAPVPHKPKKKGGFLSFLNCCAAPEADELDSPDSAQPSKSPVSRVQPSKSRTPQQDQQAQNTSVTDTSGDSKDVIDEKNAYDGVATANEHSDTAPVDPTIASVSTPETSDRQAPVPQPQLNTAPIGPQVSVQAPTPVTAQGEDKQLISDRTPEQAQRDTDIEMTDAGPSIPLSTAEVASVPEDDSHEAQPRKSQDSIHRVDLPPPPPLAERQAQTSSAVAVAHGQDPSIAFSPEPSRKWLLPSINPNLKGRKCLVLDLDETLVHSSFKVCGSQTHRSQKLTCYSYCIRQTLPSLSRLKDNITMSM